MNRIYAAWRAECCKADIEMEGGKPELKTGRPRSYTGTEKQIRKRERERTYYWQKKAATRLVSA